MLNAFVRYKHRALQHAFMHFSFPVEQIGKLYETYNSRHGQSNHCFVPEWPGLFWWNFANFVFDKCSNISGHLKD